MAEKTNRNVKIWETFEKEIPELIYLLKSQEKNK